MKISELGVLGFFLNYMFALATCSYLVLTIAPLYLIVALTAATYEK